MSRVGLARCTPSYAGIEPPWRPSTAHPELERLRLPIGSAPNPVYDAVRRALVGLGLDVERFGSGDWNPLGALLPDASRNDVDDGPHVVIKPNFIRHWNPEPSGTLASVVTHGAILAAILDYAFLAAGPNGRVTIAEAPQHDCDFDRVAAWAGLPAIVTEHATAGRSLEVVDLRREAVEYEDGVIVRRRELPGDPAGYRLVDLGAHSAFVGSGLDPTRFRGADYDSGPTGAHHSDGKHEYLLSETVLSADLVVNVPKLKTHKKTGVTLALKNMVGINGDKNLLPHHCVGSPAEGGDEFPGARFVDRVRSAATEVARQLLKRGIGTKLVRAVRRAEDRVRGREFIRSGNWHGNRTTWRMCVDLNRILYYSNRAGSHFDAGEPVRPVLTVLDGVVAGEGDGPLAPHDMPLGIVLAGTDPVAVDVAAVRLMGFDEQRLPKIRESLAAGGLRFSNTRSAADIRVGDVAVDGGRRDRAVDELEVERPFVAHPGWRGHVERA